MSLNWHLNRLGYYYIWTLDNSKRDCYLCMSRNRVETGSTV